MSHFEQDDLDAIYKAAIAGGLLNVRDALFTGIYPELNPPFVNPPPVPIPLSQYNTSMSHYKPHTLRFMTGERSRT